MAGLLRSSLKAEGSHEGSGNFAKFNNLKIPSYSRIENH